MRYDLPVIDRTVPKSVEQHGFFDNTGRNHFKSTILPEEQIIGDILIHIIKIETRPAQIDPGSGECDLVCRFQQSDSGPVVDNGLDHDRFRIVTPVVIIIPDCVKRYLSQSSLNGVGGYVHPEDNLSLFLARDRDHGIEKGCGPYLGMDVQRIHHPLRAVKGGFDPELGMEVIRKDYHVLRAVPGIDPFTAFTAFESNCRFQYQE